MNTMTAFYFEHFMQELMILFSNLHIQEETGYIASGSPLASSECALINVKLRQIIIYPTIKEDLPVVSLTGG